MPESKRNTGPNALRRGRSSAPGVSFFVTICVTQREPKLIPDIAQLVLAEAHLMTSEEVWTLRCITVMPDHLHLLFALGVRLTLAQSIARLKVRAKPLLRGKSATWQDNFYDHRLRPGDSIEATIRYIWMNPYRENLIPAEGSWPWFYCCPEEWAWFEGLTDLGRPFPEWLA